MLHKLYWTSAAVVLFGLAAAAGELAPPGTTSSPTRPGTRIEIDATARDARTGLPQGRALAAIAAWLSSTIALPELDQLPAVSYASADAMLARRYNIRAHDDWSVTVGSGSEPDIVAIYDDDRRMIYLSNDWPGSTPAGLSVLVHEMVHHIQNVAGLKYACAEAREEPAFAAQEEWLAQYGSSLETEFGIDPFTLLVRTHCLY